MSRLIKIGVLSDVHYAGPREQAEGDDYESRVIANPFLRLALRLYREHIWLRFPLRQNGQLLESQMLEDASTAKSVRIRNGRVKAIDGPFAETKEVLGGFNLIEARDMEEAVEIAAHFPWASTGCIEVRPVRDIGTVRQRVGARPEAAPVEG